MNGKTATLIRKYEKLRHRPKKSFKKEYKKLSPQKKIQFKQIIQDVLS